MPPVNITTNISAQILRPLYELLSDNTELLAQLKRQFSLPPAERIAQESERISAIQMAALLRDLAGDKALPDIGLTLGAKLPVGAYGSLSFLLIASANLRELLDNFCYYHPVIEFGVSPPCWSQRGAEFILEWPGEWAELEPVQSDIRLASGYTMIKHAQNTFCPSQVEVVGDGGQYRSRYSECLGTDTIIFGADKLRIYGDASLLDKPLVNANPSLCRVFRKELNILLQALNAQQTIIDQIHLLLSQSDNLGAVTLGSVAAELAIGERTLARQLAEYDVSFRELLANYKSTRAIRLLAEGRTVDQVSNYLGFSERAAFDRAFKKWQGITASRFQEDYLSSGVQAIDVLDGKQLPSLPVVAEQLLALINQNNYQMDELSQVVEQDPALTAKLLALANSAMYGVIKIGSIREAVVRVFGVDMLRNLALAMLANDCFDTRHCPTFCLKSYWVNALATGQLASELAKAGACANADNAYLLGLLHNIGTLLLVQRRPQDMALVLLRDDLAVAELTVKSAAEQAVLGIDSCAAGAMLAVFWHLPDYLGIAIRELTNPAYRGESQELVQLVAACEYAVRLMAPGAALPAAVEQQLAAASGLGAEAVSALLAEFSERFELIETAAAGLV